MSKLHRLNRLSELSLNLRGPLMLLLFSFIALLSPTALAALGDDLSSPGAVNAEKAKLQSSSHQLVSGAGYTVHVLDSGLTTVREYTGANGVVFAVTWKGATKPDLPTLFGSYYSEFDTADSQRVKAMGHGPVVLKTARLSVRRGGHMRALRGSAVIESLVPPGVNAEALP